MPLTFFKALRRSAIVTEQNGVSKLITSHSLEIYCCNLHYI